MKRFILLLKIASLWLIFSMASNLQAQEIDPRFYNNSPVNINFLGLAYSQVSSPNLQLSSEILALTRIVDINGQSAKMTIAFTLWTTLWIV